MSASCNACYEASTSPLWVAQFVTRLRVDQPCKRHRPAAEVRSADTTEPDPYDDFCPTCDAPDPTHTETCAVPFRTTNKRGE